MTKLLKSCTKCCEVKPVEEFHRMTAAPDGRQSTCKVCGNEHKRLWRAANREVENERYRAYRAANGAAVSKRNQSYRSEYPERARAHNAINNAITAGKLTRPGTCSKCGKPGKVEGHHDDYSKPFDVVWWCSSCHKRHHIAERQLDAVSPSLTAK